ncbi:Asp-tRNA(Asn)/Glu-tRNA(Gln) amidotransferase subunit GatB [Chloroflexota bacterium]
MNYETIIGLEVHAQLQTKSKMFCRCSTDYANAPPNTHVCPVCLGMPGVLPTINKQAVEYTIMTAIALNCTVSEYTKFDRKNYPYPDLVKGYQISQYDAPFGHGGWHTIEVGGQEKKVGITRVHLEEDVAKLLHRAAPNGETYSLVDVNRSGMPLMEIVGEPDLRSPEEAKQYLKEMHDILQYLAVSTANMEEGSFRCDANISIRPEGSPESTAKVEVKNMNSFDAVYQALEYEATRQRKAADAGKRLIQETRGWVEEKGVTVSQRSKEYAHDYRYFPEPDLPPLTISRDWVEEIRSRQPELRKARRKRFVAEYELPLYDADLLTRDKAMADYFEEICQANKGIPARIISNWFLGPVSRILNTNNIDISEFRKRVSPKQFVEILVSETQASTTLTTARYVLEQVFNTGNDPADIINEQGLSQISDVEVIAAASTQVISANPQPVADYKAGKEQALKFLVGQVMKITKGRANPQLVSQLLKEKLEGE